MKKLLQRAAALLLLSTLVTQLSTAHAQGTAFTYQGRLNSSGSNYTGSAEFQTTLWDAASGGNAVATNSPASIIVGVTNGLFILPLDFATNFPGAARWLQLDVRTAIGPFTTLAPRQALTPTPYAITAGNVTGAVNLTQLPAAVLTNGAGGVNLTGTFTGNGANVTNVNADTLNKISSGNFWQLGGNNVANGQFLGSTNNQPVEFRANNQTGLRLINNGSNAVNVVGGWSGNAVAADVVGAVIAGGGAGNYSGGSYTNLIDSGSVFSTVGGGAQNVIQTNSFESTIGGGGGNTIQPNSHTSTIGGGYVNTIQPNSYDSTIGGGFQNTIQPSSYDSTIGGGYQNTIQPNSVVSTIGGGYVNTIQTNATYSTIGGGYLNTIQPNSFFSAIPGGANNTAGSYAFAAGNRAKAVNTGAFVWGDSQDADFSSTAANQFLVRAAGGVGINTTNPVVPLTVQGSGFYNSIGAAAIAVKNSTAGRTWEWHVLDDGRMQIADLTAAATRLLVDTNGNLTVAGTVTANGVLLTSDRNAKENFTPVSVAEALRKVATLPITEWNYKSGPDTVRHVGPMAQDFRTAFGLNGDDDKHISVVDESGVALAAIQGLDQKVESGKLKVEKLETENAELKAQLNELKVLVQQLAEKK